MWRIIFILISNLFLDASVTPALAPLMGSSVYSVLSPSSHLPMCTFMPQCSRASAAAAAAAAGPSVAKADLRLPLLFHYWMPPSSSV